ncbi:MAG: glycosidase [Vicinamibacterales bacterium]
MAFDFEKALRRWTSQHTDLVELKNSRVRDAGGVYERWENPVLTASHAPLFWRYDLDRRRNPFLLERHGLAAVGAAGAVERAGKICLVVRLVARDGGSFFAVAESDNGVDNFHFWDHPLRLPEGDAPDTGLSDMRLTAHEDGWLYGVFGASRGEADGETRFGIVRTHDLVSWERLADLRSRGPAPASVVLHPELVRGRYAFHTQAGSAAEPGAPKALAIAFCENVEQAELDSAGAQIGPGLRPSAPGAPPLRTARGWLSLAVASHATPDGARSVLTVHVSDPEDPSRVTAAPAAYLLRLGDGASGATPAPTCAGAVLRATGEVLVYYSAEGGLHVATSSLERLLDYATQPPADAAGSDAARRSAFVERNLKLLARTKGKAYRGLRS